jgi:hypothetical protein
MWTGRAESPPTRIQRLADPTIATAQLDHTVPWRFHVVAEATIDMTPYQSTVAGRFHVVAEATIDMTRYQSHGRRTLSRGRRGHD